MVLIDLFISFLKIGFTSFGGLSMIPLITSEMTEHSWMTASEVSDIVAIAEMTPGPLGLNCATFAGMRTAGIAGAVAANLGALGADADGLSGRGDFFRAFPQEPFYGKGDDGRAPCLRGHDFRRHFVALHDELPERLGRSQHRRACRRGCGIGFAAQVQGQYSEGHLFKRRLRRDLLRCSGS